MGTEWKGCLKVVWWLQGCLGVVGKSVELRLRMGCKQALEKLLPYRSILCLLLACPVAPLAALKIQQVQGFPQWAKKEWGLWVEGLDS